MTIQTRTMDTWTLAAKCPYLADITVGTQTPSEISILIAPDQPHLHLHTYVWKGNPSESVALQTTLEWVSMGGYKESSN